MGLKLKRLLLRYEPPGVGLECTDEDGRIVVEHKDLPFKDQVHGVDEIYSLVEGLLESEPEFLTWKKHQRALVQLLGRLYQMDVPLPEVERKPPKERKQKMPYSQDEPDGGSLAAPVKTPRGVVEAPLGQSNSYVSVGHRIVMAGLKNKQAALNGTMGMVLKVKDSGNKFEIEVDGEERHVVKVKGAQHIFRVADGFFSAPRAALGIGAKVAICGLRNHAQLNGQFGRIIEYNEQNQRYEVRAVDTGQLFRVKTENLVPILDDEVGVDEVHAAGSGGGAFEPGRPQRPPQGSRGGRRPKDEAGAVGSTVASMGVNGQLASAALGVAAASAAAGSAVSAGVAESSSISEGCVIQLCGLKNAAWLNGEQADVISIDNEKQRYEIRLRMDGSVKKVKADNVVLVSRAPPQGTLDTKDQKGAKPRGDEVVPPPPVKHAQQRGIGLATEPYAPGTIIQLVGLRSAAALNGERGEVLKHDPNTDRYEIRLEMDGSTKKVRKDNIEPVY